MNEWSFFVEMVGREVWVKSFCGKWWEPILASVSEFDRKKLRWLNPRWENQDGRIQDGCHHQIESEWMSLSQDWISLNQSQSGVRVFLSESERRKQGVWIQDGRIQDGCHHQVESEWMSEVFFVQMVGRELWEKSFFVQMVGTNPGSVSEFERKN